jgi:hypothetical protein
MRDSHSITASAITSVTERDQVTAWKPATLSLDENPGNTWLSTFVISFMIAILVALFWCPVRRMFANVEINYNEGWNAYQAARVASGTALYRTPPGTFATGTGYPPLSFHLVSALGNTKTFVSRGRWVSLISLLTIGILVALIVRSEGGSQAAAIFSFLLYEIAIALMLPDRIGMNDPQLLAEAFSMAGLYCYVRNVVSFRMVCMAAFFFCLAGFTKQTLIAFPAAVGLDLFLRSRRTFLVWAGAMIFAAGSFATLTFLLDGRYLLVHITGKRTYSYWLAWSQFHRYALLFQTLLVIACAWSMYAFRSRRVFVLAFLFSNVLAFLLAGGAGVDMNIFFNALAATVIACGLSLSDIRFALQGWRAPILNGMSVLMFALVFISVMIFVPGQLRRNRRELHGLPAREGEFLSAVEFTRARPGPAMCESLLLCYEAGKSFEFEPFTVGDQMRTGEIKEDEVFRLLRMHHFQTIQIALRSDEQDLKDWADLRASLASDQSDPDKQRRFTPNFMKELLTDYHLSKRTSEMALFSPN